jgi:hypothetical protein
MIVFKGTFIPNFDDYVERKLVIFFQTVSFYEVNNFRSVLPPKFALFALIGFKFFLNGLIFNVVINQRKCAADDRGRHFG